MTKEEVIFGSLDNCWLALCRRMRESPTAGTQRTMNLLAQIITQAKIEAKKANTQITIEEWMAWLAENDK